MTVRTAEFEDMKRMGHIMSVSFRTAFGAFVTQETMDACAQEGNCAALLEGLFREGQMHFLMGGDSGMLVWQRTEDGAEIVAIHTLPESRGTGLGHRMLEAAMKQIGEGPVFLWAFKENTRARRFYEKHGFSWDGSERVSEFDGAVEVRYVKDGSGIKEEREKPMKKAAFICVHNSCRSQIAEALGKKLAGDVFESYSAGTETKPRINPDAVRLMKQVHGIDMEKSQYSKLLSDIPAVDVVITMGCNVQCPFLPCSHREDWGLEDPTGKDDAAFLETIRQIEEKILDLRERMR